MEEGYSFVRYKGESLKKLAEYKEKIQKLLTWIECAGITEGPLFRPIVRGGHVQEGRMSAQTVRDVMVRTGKLAELNLNLSAHSLRSGFVTTTIRQGKSERAIMNQTGHRSVSVLREYFQREEAVEDNAEDGVM